MSETRKTTGGKGLKELDAMIKSATKATPQHKTGVSLDESKKPISAADGTTADKAVSVASAADDSEPDADGEQFGGADSSDGDNHDELEDVVESDQSEDEEAVEEASSDAHPKYTNRSYTPEPESVCDDSDDDMFEAIYLPMTARKRFILKCELELMDDQQYEEAFHILMNLCRDELEEPRIPVPHETARALLGLCASIDRAREHPDAVEESPQQPSVTFMEIEDIVRHFYDFTPWIQHRFIEMVSLHLRLDSEYVDARRFPDVLLRLLLRHVRLRVGFHEKAYKRSIATTISNEECKATDPSVMTAAASAATVARSASGQLDGNEKLASNKRKRDEVDPEEQDDNPTPKKRANVATATETSTDNESDGTENSITSEAVKKAKAQANSGPKTAPAANSKKATKAQSSKKRSRDAASEDEFDDTDSDHARNRVKAAAAAAAAAQETSTTAAPASAVKKTAQNQQANRAAQTPKKRARQAADDDEAEEAEQAPATKRAKKSTAASTRNSTPTAKPAKSTKKPTKRQQNASAAATEDEDFVEEEEAPAKPCKKAAARKTTNPAAATTKRAPKRATKSAAAQKKDTVDSAAAAKEGNNEKQLESSKETGRFSPVANLDGTIETSSSQAALGADPANSDDQFVEEF